MNPPFENPGYGPEGECTGELQAVADWLGAVMASWWKKEVAGELQAVADWLGAVMVSWWKREVAGELQAVVDWWLGAVMACPPPCRRLGHVCHP